MNHDCTQQGINRIANLEDNGWIDDNIIDLFGAVIVGQRRPCSTALLSGMFYQQCEWSGGVTNTFKWTKDFNIFEMDFVIIPMNFSNDHWSLAVIVRPGQAFTGIYNINKPCILHMDSLNMHSTEEVGRVLTE